MHLTLGYRFQPILFLIFPPLRSWIPVEALCAGLGSDGRRSFTEAEGRELVLFGGKVGGGRASQAES